MGTYRAPATGEAPLLERPRKLDLFVSSAGCSEPEVPRMARPFVQSRATQRPCHQRDATNRDLPPVASGGFLLSVRCVLNHLSEDGKLEHRGLEHRGDQEQRR
jgi:hypothetical protein